MNPVDHFWSFLKMSYGGQEGRDWGAELNRMRDQKNLMQPRKPFTRPYTEEEKLHLRELLAQQDEDRAAQASQPGVAMNRITTDKTSVGQMENPPEVWDPAAVEAARRRNQENR
jgi:hypothetical protein